jgi:hypothetical protein
MSAGASSAGGFPVAVATDAAIDHRCSPGDGVRRPAQVSAGIGGGAGTGRDLPAARSAPAVDRRPDRCARSTGTRRNAHRVAMISVDDHGRSSGSTSVADRRRRDGRLPVRSQATIDTAAARSAHRRTAGSASPSRERRRRAVRRAMHAAAARQRAPRETATAATGAAKPDAGEEHLLARGLLQPPGEVVAGNREPVDAAEAMQSATTTIASPATSRASTRRLGTLLLHTGKVRAAPPSSVSMHPGSRQVVPGVSHCERQKSGDA